jgi:MoxR-like ATPase
MNAIKAEWERVKRALCLLVLRTAYIYGPPGIGKTYAAFNFGCAERGFYAMTITAETSANECRGHFLFIGGDARWHDGPFVRAMREGKRLVINEISNASSDVLQLLFPILESPETARLTLPTGETVSPADGFQVVATDNFPADRLPEALQDRFQAFLRVTAPHPDAFAGLDPDLRELAEASLSIDDERRISARQWKNIQTFRAEVGLCEACLWAFGPDRGQMVYDAIEMHLAAKGKRRTMG